MFTKTNKQTKKKKKTLFLNKTADELFIPLNKNIT